MMLLRTEICLARVRDIIEASESNVRTSLSLWHGQDCDREERFVGRQVVTVRMQQATKLIFKMTVKMKEKLCLTVLREHSVTRADHSF